MPSARESRACAISSPTRSWFRFHEKGGKYHVVPAHHEPMEYLDGYLAAAGIAGEEKTHRLADEGLTANGALQMVKRRASDAGLGKEICCHTFRATGITAFLAKNGELAIAQRIAGHETPRTTALYNRSREELT